MAEFTDGAVIVPTSLEKRSESGLEPHVGVVMQPAVDVVFDFGNGTQRPIVAHDDGIFIDTAVMMKALRDVLQDPVRFEKKIVSFDELSADLIVDCTGLGTGALNTDPNVVSVQGHLIMLKDQTPQDLQCMILVDFGEDKTDSGHEVKRSFYQFPKHLLDTAANDIGVIGGTVIEGATIDTPNVKEFDIMLAGAKRFYAPDGAGGQRVSDSIPLPPASPMSQPRRRGFRLRNPAGNLSNDPSRSRPVNGRQPSGTRQSAFVPSRPPRSESIVARRGLPCLTALEGHRMDRDLVKKARDGRLQALKKMGSRPSPAMNVLPLLPGSAGQRSGMLNDPRKVLRAPAAFEPPVPLATGLGSIRRQPV